MHTILLKKKILLVIEIFLIVVLCIGCVTAASYPIPDPLPFDPNKLNVSDSKPDDGIEIQNFTSYVGYWNKRMQWEFSDKHLTEVSLKIENYSKTSLIKNGDYFHISNLTKHDEEISKILNLSEDQKLKFIETDRKQLEIDHQNYHKSPQDFRDISMNTVSAQQERALFSNIAPPSQSAPFALGDLYYLIIYVDFSPPSSQGPWTDNDRYASLHNVSIGTSAIRMQAPSGITSNNIGSLSVFVNREDTEGGWVIGGWMELAAYNLGFRTDSNGDGRTTDDMVRHYKNLNNYDSVLIVYCTHDDKGAYTIPGDWYADWVVVSHWGRRDDGSLFTAEAGSYEHEILHQYGALDEWIGMSSCGERSGFSVSPMHEMYTNTNHQNCNPHVDSSVMNNPYYYNGNNPLWYNISDSTRKFIGWGDFDADGTLDPLDSRPAGNNDKIGIFRSSTGYWYLNYNFDDSAETSFYYGGSGDIPVIGDWDGDEDADIGYFRPSNRNWYLDSHKDGTTDFNFQLGNTGDIPIVGDWNGNGYSDVAVFRPSTGYWYFDYNLDGTVDKSFRYGGSTDKIVKGDWQGTGRDGIAIFRPSTGYWYFDYNLDGTIDKSFRYGGSTDRIIVGNWAGYQDGIAIFRPSTGYWYFDYNLDGTVDKSFRYGGSTDQILKGDWDGDGREGIGIFRPSTGYWYLDSNLDGTIDSSFRYGGSTDTIIVGRWI